MTLTQLAFMPKNAPTKKDKDTEISARLQTQRKYDTQRDFKVERRLAHEDEANFGQAASVGSDPEGGTDTGFYRSHAR
jgi:hypothetical protein